ncbi:hypothetical protein [Cohaesibacter intestini]|uniref:hypothetical protein n=1 Tax=Cohaesibacter intestini TaxID=2211145 RepID=UPI000DE90978|nr:hypothetical protein [Cohaesibacter intestini]
MFTDKFNLRDVLLYNQTLIKEAPRKSIYKNERAALNKASKYFDAPLEGIPADITFIETKLGRGPVRCCPPQAPEISSFKNDRKNLKGAVTRFLGHKNPNAITKESLLPDGKFLLDYVQKNGGIQKLPDGSPGQKLPPPLASLYWRTRSRGMYSRILHLRT